MEVQGACCNLTKAVQRLVQDKGDLVLLVTLQRALLSDLDKGTSFNGKYASAPRCLARPGNAATNNEWRLSPKGWKDEQRMEDGLK